MNIIENNDSKRKMSWDDDVYVTSFLLLGTFLLPYLIKGTNNDHETELFADNNKGLTS